MEKFKLYRERITAKMRKQYCVRKENTHLITISQTINKRFYHGWLAEIYPSQLREKVNEMLDSIKEIS